ncbi:MAG: hypothetical protein GEU90_16685 [Gemmatimonas sp.]|nr:hypothetical protein [Gemmatimonas sp.]
MIGQPRHGWGLAQRIEQMSRVVFQVSQGSPYPALQWMKRQGSEWRTAYDRPFAYARLSSSSSTVGRPIGAGTARDVNRSSRWEGRSIVRLVSKVRQRLCSLLFGARDEREIEQELGFQVERAVEEHLRRGMAPEEARGVAQLRLGGAVRRWWRQPGMPAAFGRWSGSHKTFGTASARCDARLLSPPRPS